jgi:hypothetical protein
VADAGRLRPGEDQRRKRLHATRRLDLDGSWPHLRHRYAYTKGATALGSERIGGLEWDVYSQPSVGGVVYVHTYADGVEVAVFGGATRSSVRALAGSLGSRV